jgi:hypothetical protein
MMPVVDVVKGLFGGVIALSGIGLAVCIVWDFLDEFENNAPKLVPAAFFVLILILSVIGINIVSII